MSKVCDYCDTGGRLVLVVGPLGPKRVCEDCGAVYDAERPEEAPLISKAQLGMGCGLPTATGQRLAEDVVNHPPHYTSHPSGIEVIQITEHMGFCLGNAVKYILRCDLKGNAIEDLKKARWYIDREIAKREKA